MIRRMFHVRHNAKPILIREILQILDGRDLLTLDEVRDIGRQRGYHIGTAMQSQQSLKENPMGAVALFYRVHS